MKYIPRKSLLILVAVALLSVAVPYIDTALKIGQAPTVPVGVWNDADYYYERMHEIKDGYPLLGNPYFIEHRNDIAPAFFLADWLAAIPLLAGLPLMPVILLDFFIWSLIFLILTYIFLKLLDLPPTLTLLGTILSYLELYLFMIRPVSMQVIFPFFILFFITYVVWLKSPHLKKYGMYCALSAAVVSYLYTYAWQVALVMLVLTPIMFLVTRRKSDIKPALATLGVFILASAPLILMTLRQMKNPFYWESMERIGLIYTHLPPVAVLYCSVWIVIAFVVWWILPRRGEQLTFFILSGVAMAGVASSMIFTGKDLELPQHIERFIIFWLVAATFYLFVRVRQNWNALTSKGKPTVLILFALLVLGNLYYLKLYSPIIIWNGNYQSVAMKNAQGFEKPLAWLDENIQDQSVIWADPQGLLNGYITMLTKHYTLFRAAGAIHLVSGKEVEERYLVANYFNLSTDLLERDYQAYAGVGNAHHKSNTYNREVKLCRLLHLERFMGPCGVEKSPVQYRSESYFKGLYDQYVHSIKPNIKAELEKYQVRYIIHDVLTDSPQFDPSKIPGAKLIHTDGRFSIYKL